METQEDILTVIAILEKQEQTTRIKRIIKNLKSILDYEFD